MNKKHKQQSLKTKYIAYAAMSIDGRISLDSKKLPDWTSKEDWKFFQKELSKMDAVVSGMRTYEVAKRYMSKRVAYVLTTTVKKISSTGTVTRINPNTVLLKNLLNKYKKVAIVGGASVYQYMLNKNLLDELYLTIEPVVFGRGRELFVGGKKKFNFKLKSIKKLNKTGTLLIHYVK